MAVAKVPEHDPSYRARRALRSLLARGASPDEIVEIVRWMQIDLLQGVAYLMDGPDPSDATAERVLDGAGWGLHETTADGSCAGALTGLHESVITTDPEAEVDEDDASA